MLPLIEVKTANFPVKPLESEQSRVNRAAQARRGVRANNAERGHSLGYTQDNASGNVHVVGSVITQLVSGEGLEDGVRADHIRYEKVAARGRRNILFLIDTSGSMLSADRLAMVKGCVVSLLKDAYVARTRVALISYGGAHARLVLPFTSSPEMAAARIDQMKGGGTTPLLEAIALATNLIQDMDGEPLEIVLLSDGRYNRVNGVSSDQVFRKFSEYCKKHNVRMLLVDATAGNRTAQKRTILLARALHADYKRLVDMRAESFAEAIDEA